MPTYDVTWEAHGTAKVEADDFAEAEAITKSSLESLDSSMFEEVDVVGVHVTEGVGDE